MTLFRLQSPAGLPFRVGVGLLSRIARGLAFAGLGLVGTVPVVAEASPAVTLGVQRCNTWCQTRFTDCLDRCDDGAECEARCEQRVSACVKRCAAPPVPTPPPKS